MAKTRINGLLVIYHDDFQTYASNLFQHVHSFREGSAFPVSAVNTHLGFPDVLRDLEFSAIVLHYSLFSWRPFFLDDEFRAYLAASPASYKVAFFQDEYRFWPERAEVLNRFHV